MLYVGERTFHPRISHPLDNSTTGQLTTWTIHPRTITLRTNLFAAQPFYSYVCIPVYVVHASLHICIFIHMYTHEFKYVCLCVCTFWEGKCPISQGKLSGGELSGGELSWGGRGPFPIRRRARDRVPYATMYTSAFISVRQQAFKAPAYEGVSKCIFSCFIYYGVKANVRSFGVNSIQMLFISQTRNSKLS